MVICPGGELICDMTVPPESYKGNAIYYWFVCIGVMVRGKGIKPGKTNKATFDVYGGFGAYSGRSQIQKYSIYTIGKTLGGVDFDQSLFNINGEAGKILMTALGDKLKLNNTDLHKPGTSAVHQLRVKSPKNSR